MSPLDVAGTCTRGRGSPVMRAIVPFVVPFMVRGETPVASGRRLPLDTAHERRATRLGAGGGESLVDAGAPPRTARPQPSRRQRADVAVALARLGCDTGFHDKLADDHGRLIADHLTRSASRLVTDPHVVPRHHRRWPRFQADGSARYTFDIDWRIGPVEVSAPPLALHACSLGAVVTPGCDDVRALMARLRGASTAWSTSNMRPTSPGACCCCCAKTVAPGDGWLSDVVKASDEDLERLLCCPGESRPPRPSACSPWARLQWSSPAAPTARPGTPTGWPSPPPRWLGSGGRHHRCR